MDDWVLPIHQYCNKINIGHFLIIKVSYIKYLFVLTKKLWLNFLTLISLLSYIFVVIRELYNPSTSLILLMGLEVSKYTNTDANS